MRDRLRRGAALFEAGHFFEAHEVWEEEWLGKSGDQRLVLQGLIQLAAALYKESRGDAPEGCIRLLEAAVSKLRAGKAELDGLPLSPFELRAASALETARRRISVAKS